MGDVTTIEDEILLVEVANITVCPRLHPGPAFTSLEYVDYLSIQQFRINGSSQVRSRS
jgi:hypothetical protein